MANSAHSTLTGSDLHEPKGYATASADTVYVADGAGSGTQQKIAAGQINTSSIKNVNKVLYFYTTVQNLGATITYNVTNG